MITVQMTEEQRRGIEVVLRAWEHYLLYGAGSGWPDIYVAVDAPPVEFVHSLVVLIANVERVVAPTLDPIATKLAWQRYHDEYCDDPGHRCEACEG